VSKRFITGYGVCSALGIGREAFVRAMMRPTLLHESPARPIQAFDASEHEGARVAEVPEFDAAKYLGDKGLRTLDRLTKLVLVAARFAAQDAGLKKDGIFVAHSAERVGICCSNAYGSLEAITELNRVAKLEDARYINPAKFPNTVANSASGYVSIWEDFRALNVAISDGNCGALDAFALADIHLDQDRADAILVGGGEASSEALYLAFQKLGVLETKAVLGEGAAFVVVEKAPRGEVLAEVWGTGNAFSAPDNEHQVTHGSAEALERAMRAALADAGIGRSDVDLVVSGASGLRVFDKIEIAAIKDAIREDVAIAAPKMILGETLGAGGAMAAVSALAYLDGAPPTPIVSGTIRSPLRTIVLTSMGFYGNASAVVLRAR
jgi:3-oxoacyl-(acyl-carrier-protein) synthase